MFGVSRALSLGERTLDHDARHSTNCITTPGDKAFARALGKQRPEVQ